MPRSKRKSRTSPSSKKVTPKRKTSSRKPRAALAAKTKRTPRVAKEAPKKRGRKRRENWTIAELLALPVNRRRLYMNGQIVAADPEKFQAVVRMLDDIEVAEADLEDQKQEVLQDLFKASGSHAWQHPETGQWKVIQVRSNRWFCRNKPVGASERA